MLQPNENNNNFGHLSDKSCSKAIQVARNTQHGNGKVKSQLFNDQFFSLYLIIMIKALILTRVYGPAKVET